MRIDPTHAQSLAIHFLKMTRNELEPATVASTVKQVKGLMSMGYTVPQITYAIDTITSRRANIYSFQYIVKCIDDVLRDVQNESIKEEVKAQIASAIEEKRGEAVKHDDSTERNRKRAERTQLQSRFGKKFDFDMFKR